MRRLRLFPTLMLATLLALGGCDGVLMDPEDKINAAVPLAQEVNLRKLALMARLPKDARKAAETDLARILKLRALTCAKGFAPSRWTSVAATAAQLGDHACFAEQDAVIGKWIGLRMIGVVLADGPLRPVPAVAPKFIVAPGNIYEAIFASHAGVGVFRTQAGLALLELDGGKQIYAEPLSNQQPGALSANGRLQVVAQDGRLSVRQTEDGAVLLSLPQVSLARFHWLGKSAALYVNEGGKVMLIDFANGKESPAPELSGIESPVIAINDDETQFISATYRTVSKFELKRSGQNASIALLEEKPSNGLAWRTGNGALNADQRYFVEAGRDLTVTTLASFAQEKTPLEPMRLINVIATPDPDKMLVKAPTEAGKMANYLLSIKDQTMAPVDTGALLSERIIYIPVLKRLATISETKIALLDTLAAGDAVPLSTQIAKVVEQANARKLDIFKREEEGGSDARARDPFALSRAGNAAGFVGLPELTARKPRPDDVTKPVFAGMGSDVQVEAIGVYQPPRPSPGANAQGGGTIDVRVQAASKPIVLVLSSYERVNWRLSLAPGARLAAVVLSSYNNASDVVGNGGARVVRDKLPTAYERNNATYREFEESVRQLIGKPLYLFQGSYEGRAFSVGSN
ncbi:MAG: hypothetical protein ABIT83_09765 [Massilia sp.]